jgi:hypothetical protein
MGYYTSHKLSIINQPSEDYSQKIEGLKEKVLLSKDFTEIRETIDEIKRLENYDLEKEVTYYITEDTDFNYAISELDEFGQECKWYSHQEDMKKLSKKFKDALFELEGKGEESGDIWKEYYKNGKMQRCAAKMIFDEYKEHLLK